MADLDSRYRPHLSSLLSSGEELRGLLAASQQKGMFKGGVVVIGVTGERLIVQPLSRRGEPDGEAESLRPRDIASVSTGRTVGDALNPYEGLMDAWAAKLEIRKADGGKLKLALMRAEGGMMGKLGGGEGQRRGVEALAAWLTDAGTAPG
jgi:hypothetical protein